MKPATAQRTSEIVGFILLVAGCVLMGWPMGAGIALLLIGALLVFAGNRG